MMKKRTIFIFAFCFCMPIFHATIYAEKIMGQAVNTDIVAYINGLPIKSYNINGQTAVIAEDLKKYGVGVDF